MALRVNSYINRERILDYVSFKDYYLAIFRLLSSNSAAAPPPTTTMHGHLLLLLLLRQPPRDLNSEDSRNSDSECSPFSTSIRDCWLLQLGSTSYQYR